MCFSFGSNPLLLRVCIHTWMVVYLCFLVCHSHGGMVRLVKELSFYISSWNWRARGLVPYCTSRLALSEFAFPWAGISSLSEYLKIAFAQLEVELDCSTDHLLFKPDYSLKYINAVVPRARLFNTVPHVMGDPPDYRIISLLLQFCCCYEL